MHFLPLLLIPVFLWIALKARRYGLFAEVPVDPEARITYWASQALAQLKVELAVARELRLEEQQLRYRKGKTEGRIFSAQGHLYKQEGAAARESLGEIGPDGGVTFLSEPGLLHVSILAKDGELSRYLEVSLPVAGGGRGGGQQKSAPLEAPL
ncbi:MAG: hypothetical protein KF760_26675 [Candidatus Eremiobacteraeota bacterium]|nr:hypothetical protein [Candidatus Eremiobacteraeota bacterium]MCW5868819.1 hypothetical protein [Candidatus Eremiobacteraeota bacterium]